MREHEDLSQSLHEAATRLRGKSLFDAGACLSVLMPGEAAFLLLDQQSDIGRHDLASAGQPASGTAALHARIYQARGDVGAVLQAAPTWAAALGQLAAPMPGIFDEQIRHLGAQIGQVPDWRQGSKLEAALALGNNGYGLGTQVLFLGMTLERLVFNAELLEKCAKAYLLAHSTGMPVGRIPWLVRWVAGGRLRKDQRRAAQRHAAGQLAERSKAY